MRRPQGRRREPERGEGLWRGAGEDPVRQVNLPPATRAAPGTRPPRPPKPSMSPGTCPPPEAAAEPAGHGGPGPAASGPAGAGMWEDDEHEATQVQEPPPAIAALAAPAPVVPARAPLPTSPGIAPQQHAPIDALPERYEPREDVRTLVRALVDEAVAPLLRITIQLEHRIQRLEERPPPGPVYVAQPAAPATADGGQLQSHAAAISSPAQIVGPAPILNVAASERDGRIHVDGGPDGSKS